MKLICTFSSYESEDHCAVPHLSFWEAKSQSQLSLPPDGDVAAEVELLL